MQKNNKNVTEYVIDRFWSLWLVEDDNTSVFLFDNRTMNMKFILKEKGHLDDVESYFLEVIKNVNVFKDDIIFDTVVDPKHIVNEISKLYKTCTGEKQFIANVTYMILGAISKTYQTMAENNDGFTVEDSDPAISTIKAVHKIGELLIQVEGTDGTVNAVANNKTSPF